MAHRILPGRDSIHPFPMGLPGAWKWELSRNFYWLATSQIAKQIDLYTLRSAHPNVSLKAVTPPGSQCPGTTHQQLSGPPSSDGWQDLHSHMYTQMQSVCLSSLPLPLYWSKQLLEEDSPLTLLFSQCLTLLLTSSVNANELATSLRSPFNNCSSDHCLP